MIKTYQKKLFIGTIIIEDFCLGEKKFPRSKKNIEAFALYRGSTSGFEYAESFMLISLFIIPL